MVAKDDPDRDQILADLHQQIRDLPDGAVVLAEDETQWGWQASNLRPSDYESLALTD